MTRFVSHLTILFLLLTSSAFSWQEAFLEKIRKNERPEWMLQQIRADLKPFAKYGISKKSIHSVMARKVSLSRYKIIKNQVCVNDVRVDSGNALTNALCELAKLVPLPYIDFVISFNDSFYHVPILQTCSGPLFSFAKRPHDSGIILIPDYMALQGYPDEMKEVEKGIASYPWELKEEKAFWRGATSGFLPGSLEFMRPHDFHKFPRVNLCRISHENSALVDAGFNPIIHIADDMKTILHRLGYVKDYVAISEHLKYKYQILVDGFTCAWHRGYWELFSNCVMFKQTSPDFQWYYGALKPYEHFIPIENDLSDLIEKIHWAKQHDEEVQHIVQNANAFAHTHLRYEDTMLYIYLLLTEYAKLLHPR